MDCIVRYVYLWMLVGAPYWEMSVLVCFLLVQNLGCTHRSGALQVQQPGKRLICLCNKLGIAPAL